METLSYWLSVLRRSWLPNRRARSGYQNLTLDKVIIKVASVLWLLWQEMSTQCWQNNYSRSINKVDRTGQLSTNELAKTKHKKSGIMDRKNSYSFIQLVVILLSLQSCKISLLLTDGDILIHMALLPIELIEPNTLNETIRSRHDFMQKYFILMIFLEIQLPFRLRNDDIVE